MVNVDQSSIDTKDPCALSMVPYFHFSDEHLLQRQKTFIDR